MKINKNKIKVDYTRHSRLVDYLKDIESKLVTQQQEAAFCYYKKELELGEVQLQFWNWYPNFCNEQNGYVRDLYLIDDLKVLSKEDEAYFENIFECLASQALDNKIAFLKELGLSEEEIMEYDFDDEDNYYVD